MISNENISEYIENYLDNKLDGKEAESFLASIASKNAWNKLYKEEKVVREGIRQYGILQVKEMMKKDLARPKVKPPTSSKNLLIGLLLVSVASITLFMLMDKDRPSLPAPVKDINSDSTHKPTQPEASENEQPVQQISTAENRAVENMVISSITTEPVQIELKEVVIVTTKEAIDLPPNTTKSVLAPIKVADNKPIKQTAKTAIDCSTLKANYTSTPTCIDEASGIIQVNATTGGTAPYTTLLLDEQEDEVPNYELAAGNYTLIVTDKNACKKAVSIEVKSKACFEEVNLLFDPSQMSTVEIPLKYDAVSFKVLDQRNQVKYEEEINASAGVYKYSANGYNKPLQPGLYVIQVNYENNLTQNIYLTVL